METIRLNIKEAVVVRKRGKAKYDVALEIVKKPKDRNVTITNKLERIDDVCFIEDYNDKKNGLLFGGGAVLFSLVIFFTVGNTLENGQFTIVMIMLSLIMIHGIMTIFRGYLFKNKKVIMDREQGLCSYPGFWVEKRVVTRFDDMVFFIVNVGKMAAPVLKAPHKNKITNFIFVAIDTLDFLSFYVWYMDKNRPLPPGDAFDPYRQRDYERRKAAGFPKPLYSSEISTPEATPEQQAEREHIGGW
ncbi:hypothetical protein ACFSTE_12075 [Aquimarina hainanensis]|uniref:RDD family protein n=1 Tax=Aquimarina hainanensis TaxID=1578017 RepID=A0ABW5N7Y5_9FLAO